MKNSSNKHGRAAKALALTTAAATMFVMTLAPSCAFASEGSVEKDESVYVITDSSGAQTEVIVSDHLINNSQLEKIEDLTNLKDIENIKGDEKFRQASNDSISWDAEGNDIYYQGNTDKETPVRMHVSYKLDGREISGKELKGKSGDLEIKISYENKSSVNGHKVPFIVLSGLVVTDGCLENISVDNGKVIDDGEKQIVVAMAAPGLASEMGISESRLGMGDSVTIKAKADKFNVEDIMTVITNSVFNDIDTGDLGNLNMDDQVNKLDSGAKKLVQGSQEMSAGTELLKKKAPELNGGVSQINEGLKTMYSSIKGSGNKEDPGLSNALQAVMKGITDLKGGLKTLSAGIDSYVDTANGYNTAAKDKATAAAESAGKAAQEAQAACSQLSSISTTDENKSRVDAAKANINTAMNAIADHDSAEYKALEDAYNQLNAYSSPDNSALASAAQTAGAAAKDAKTASDKAAEAAKSAGTSAFVLNHEPGASGASDSGGLKQVASSGLGGITADGTGSLDYINSNLGKINEGVVKLQTAFEYVDVKNPGVLAAMDQVQQGTSELADKSEQLDSGAKAISSGMAQLYNEGIKKIVELYNGELKGLASGLSGMMDASEDYNSFTKIPSGMNGSVKFIYKTTITE